jgi:murein DD-endopeptidase MepM/ murein hydrolase activator NlpD
MWLVPGWSWRSCPSTLVNGSTEGILIARIGRTLTRVVAIALLVQLVSSVSTSAIYSSADDASCSRDGRLLLATGGSGQLGNPGGFAQTSSRFLVLPFSPSPDMHIQQGWRYTFAAPRPPCNPDDPYLHCGVDYIKGTVNRSPTWKAFDVLAAADGEACGNCVTGPGDRVWIKHDVGGSVFYTYYGHLSEIAPHIPLGSQGHTVLVRQGERIGIAGETGAEGVGIHLHFQLKDSGNGSLDPYDLYTTAADYPGPNETNQGKCGANYHWTTDPPTYYSCASGMSDAYMVSQPDHLFLRPGESKSVYFDIQNTGRSVWGHRQFRLENVNDQTLGAPQVYELDNEIPPTQVARWTINVTAPQDAGRYVAEWRMTCDGEPFGPKMSCLVVVRPGGDPGGDPKEDDVDDINLVELVLQWLGDLLDQVRTRLNELWEDLKRELEKQLERELERLWREFWEGVAQQCCGASALAPAALLVGIWGFNRRQRREANDSGREEPDR